MRFLKKRLGIILILIFIIALTAVIIFSSKNKNENTTDSNKINKNGDITLISSEIGTDFNIDKLLSDLNVKLDYSKILFEAPNGKLLPVYSDKVFLEYKGYYWLNYKDGKIDKLYKITTVDTTKPVINIIGTNGFAFLNKNFKLPDYEINDNSGEQLKAIVKLSYQNRSIDINNNTFKVGDFGSYHYTISATDLSGNTESKVVEIEVMDKGKLYDFSQQASLMDVYGASGAQLFYNGNSEFNYKSNGSLKLFTTKGEARWPEIHFKNLNIDKFDDVELVYFWVYNNSEFPASIILNDKKAFYDLPLKEWSQLIIHKNELNSLFMVNGKPSLKITTMNYKNGTYKNQTDTITYDTTLYFCDINILRTNENISTINNVTDWTFESKQYLWNSIEKNNGSIVVSEEKAHNSKKSLKITGSADTFTTLKFYNDKAFSKYAKGSTVGMKLYAYIDGGNNKINLFKWSPNIEGNFGIIQKSLSSGQWIELQFKATVQEGSMGRFIQIAINEAVPSDTIYIDDISIFNIVNNIADYSFENYPFYADDIISSNGSLKITNALGHNSHKSLELTQSKDKFSTIKFYNNNLLDNHSVGDILGIKMFIYIDGSNKTVNFVKAWPKTSDKFIFIKNQLNNYKWIEITFRAYVEKDKFGKYIQIAINEAKPNDKIYIDDIGFSPIDWSFDGYKFSEDDFSYNNGNLSVSNIKGYNSKSSLKFTNSVKGWSVIKFYNDDLLKTYSIGDPVAISLNAYVEGSNGTVNFLKKIKNSDVFIKTKVENNFWHSLTYSSIIADDGLGKYITFTINNAAPTDNIYIDNIKVEKVGKNPVDYSFEDYKYFSEDISNTNGTLSVSSERGYNSRKSLLLTNSKDDWSVIDLYNLPQLNKLSIGSLIRLRLHVYIDGSNMAINIVKSDGDFALSKLESGKWVEVIVRSSVKENALGKYAEFIIHKALATDKIYIDNIAITSMDWTFENYNISENDFSHNNGDLYISNEKAFNSNKSLEFTGSLEGWSVIKFYNDNLLRDYSAGDNVAISLNAYISGSTGTVNFVKKNNDDYIFIKTKIESNFWHSITYSSVIADDGLGKYITFIINNATPMDKVYLDNITIEKTSKNSVDYTFENYKYYSEDIANTNGNLYISTKRGFNSSRSLMLTNSKDSWSVIDLYGLSGLDSIDVGNISRIKFYMYIEGSSGTINIVKPDGNFAQTNIVSANWVEVTVISKVMNNALGKYVEFIVHNAKPSDEIYFDNISIS